MEQTPDDNKQRDGELGGGCCMQHQETGRQKDGIRGVIKQNATNSE